MNKYSILAENFQSIWRSQCFSVFHNFNSGVDPKSKMSISDTARRDSLFFPFSLFFGGGVSLFAWRRTQYRILTAKYQIQDYSRAACGSSRLYFGLANISFSVDDLAHSTKRENGEFVISYVFQNGRDYKQIPNTITENHASQKKKAIEQTTEHKFMDQTCLCILFISTISWSTIPMRPETRTPINIWLPLEINSFEDSNHILKKIFPK